MRSKRLQRCGRPLTGQKGNPQLGSLETMSGDLDSTVFIVTRYDKWYGIVVNSATKDGRSRMRRGCYCDGMPASFTTFAHLAVSDFMKTVNCSMVKD
jgi:hypothetical protein